MSLLGSTVDVFITSLASIVNFILTIINIIIGFIYSLGSIITTILNIIYLMFNLFEIFLSIALNPYLLCLFLLGTSLYYCAFAGNSRKDMFIKMISYWKYVIESTFKIVSALYTLVTRLIVGIIDMI
jgi:phage-related protein